MSGIEDMNIFMNQGTVINFNNPTGQASRAADTFTNPGHAGAKQLTEMLPMISSQPGAGSRTNLRRLAEALPNLCMESTTYWNLKKNWGKN